MFFILSKIFQFLVNPLPLLFLSLLGIVLWYRRKWTRTLLLLVTVCFYGLSTPYTADYLMQWLEMPRVPRHALQPHYDVVVVLTGMMYLALSQEGHPEFESAVDRILAGMTFVKQGIGDVLLISGGSGNPFDQSRSEALLLQHFAVQQGLSEAQILVEASSRNTYENALYSARLLRQHHYQRVLLITSAFHMRRSVAAFRKQGIQPDPYPVDFRGMPAVTPFAFIPTEGSLCKMQTVIHELVGLLLYRIQGYI